MMQHYFVRATVVLVLVGASLYASRDEVAPGLWYEHRVQEGKAPLSIHFLEVDLQKNTLRLEVAQRKATGVEKTSSIATRLGGIAAVNGGFFVRDRGVWDGCPQGTCRVNGKWISDSWWPFAMGWNDNEAQVTMGPVTMKARLIVDGQELPITRINQYRRGKDSILYTPAFDTSTWTDENGTELIIRDGIVQDISSALGNNAIPERGFVYSVGRDAGVDVSCITPGMSAQVTYVFATRNRDTPWERCEDILEGWPLLIDRGVIENFAPERYLEPKDVAGGRKKIAGFIANKNPRTAAGLLENGHVLFVVVDGRQPGISVGMSIPELARLLHDEGCSHALNLDGGGSSTCYLQGKVVNSTSGDPRRPWEGTGERAVSDAIVIIPKEK